jgi:hypothetical protein
VVGNPAQILSPDRHDEIWAVQEPLNFPKPVYGFDRGIPDLMIHITRRLSESLASHQEDTVASISGNDIIEGGAART